MLTLSFFRENRARTFMEHLEAQGVAAELWTGRDGFGQRQYIVKWHNPYQKEEEE